MAGVDLRLRLIFCSCKKEITFLPQYDERARYDNPGPGCSKPHEKLTPG